MEIAAIGNDAYFLKEDARLRGTRQFFEEFASLPLQIEIRARVALHYNVQRLLQILGEQEVVY